MSDIKQKMGLFGAISTIVGLIIGSAIFVLLPEITGMAGGSVWLAYILSGIPTFFAAFYLIQMGGALPVSGAHYVAITRWVNPLFGFATSFGGVISILSVVPLVSMGFGDYIQSFFPTANAKLMAILLVGFFCLINYFGVKFFSAIQISMFVLLLLAILTYIFSGLNAGDPANRIPFMPNGTGSFIIAVAIATNSWLGIVGVTEIAGMVKNPKQNIPAALVISVILVAFLYGGMAWVFSGVMGSEQAGKIGSSAVLVAAESFLSRPVILFVAFGAMLSMATSINAFILLIINIVSPMCHNKIFPESLIKENRFKVPGSMIVIIFLFSTVLIVAFGASLTSYAIMSMVGLMFLQFAGAAAMVRMPRRSPELFKKSAFKFPLPIRWLIFIFCTIIFWGMIGFGFLADYKVALSFFVILLLSLVYWSFRSAYLKRQGEDIIEVIKKNNDAIIKKSLN